jgi:hypothetical protein
MPDADHPLQPLRSLSPQELKELQTLINPPLGDLLDEAAKDPNAAYQGSASKETRSVYSKADRIRLTEESEQAATDAQHLQDGIEQAAADAQHLQDGIDGYVALNRLEPFRHVSRSDGFYAICKLDVTCGRGGPRSAIEVHDLILRCRTRNTGDIPTNYPRIFLYAALGEHTIETEEDIPIAEPACRILKGVAALTKYPELAVLALVARETLPKHLTIKHEPIYCRANRLPSPSFDLEVSNPTSPLVRQDPFMLLFHVPGVALNRPINAKERQRVWENALLEVQPFFHLRIRSGRLWEQLCDRWNKFFESGRPNLIPGKPVQLSFATGERVNRVRIGTET